MLNSLSCLRKNAHDATATSASRNTKQSTTVTATAAIVPLESPLDAAVGLGVGRELALVEPTKVFWIMVVVVVVGGGVGAAVTTHSVARSGNEIFFA